MGLTASLTELEAAYDLREGVNKVSLLQGLLRVTGVELATAAMERYVRLSMTLLYLLLFPICPLPLSLSLVPSLSFLFSLCLCQWLFPRSIALRFILFNRLSQSRIGCLYRLQRARSLRRSRHCVFAREDQESCH